jgi:ribosomal protein S18 acetylase RimI-like enzyme
MAIKYHCLNHEMIIRKALATDFEQIFKLHCRVESLKDPPLPSDPWPGKRLDNLMDRGPWTDPQGMFIHLGSILTNQDAIMLAALGPQNGEKEKIIGILEAWLDPCSPHLPSPQRHCLLSALYIDPSARGLGVGRKLVDSLASMLQSEHGMTCLAIVTEPAPDATPFYEKTGFNYWNQGITVEADILPNNSKSNQTTEIFHCSSIMTPSANVDSILPHGLLQEAGQWPLICGVNLSRGWFMHRLTNGFPAPEEAGVSKLIFWSLKVPRLLAFIEAVQDNPVTPEIFALSPDLRGFELLLMATEHKPIMGALEAEYLRAAIHPWTRGAEPDRELTVSGWHSLFRRQLFA